METPLMTSGGYFKSVKIVHFALIAGIVFFALTSIFLHQNGYKTFGEDLDGPFLIIVPLLALAGIFTSNFLYKKRINEIDKQLPLSVKLVNYRAALIVKLALLEAPSFFTVIAYLLTGNYIYLGIVLILLIVFLLYTPTKEKLINELELPLAEVEIINNPEAEID
ncbi:MAG: hypothetical protein KKF98_12880 [Bacteroidetes bacterium]|nr:hypothetical protein [Bacteroidota bacterium]